MNKRLLGSIHYYLGVVLVALDRPRDALAEYRRSLQEDPAKFGALNNLALLLAEGSDLSARDPARAVEVANRAVKLQPENWGSWRTLGVVRYRAGEWKGAVAALEKSQQLGGRGDEIVQLFLAMAHRKAGDRERVRMCYGRALELAKGNKLPGGDLRRYRAEAAELLGKNDRPGTNSKEAPLPKK